VDHIDVYARVSPADKMRVVDALQKARARGGHDRRRRQRRAGTEEGPTSGIAMGLSGTDVAREASAMTLTDDNFASIVAAVEEGRGVFGNIKKYLMFLLSSNVGEIGPDGGTALLGMPLPLTAVQILYVNLATDGLPALALAVDPPENDLMQRPPPRPAAGIFGRGCRADAHRRGVVGCSPTSACSPGPCTRARPLAAGDVHDLRVASADPVPEGVQLSIRPGLGAAPDVRQPLAEPRGRVEVMLLLCVLYLPALQHRSTPSTCRRRTGRSCSASRRGCCRCWTSRRRRCEGDDGRAAAYALGFNRPASWCPSSAGSAA